MKTRTSAIKYVFVLLQPMKPQDGESFVDWFSRNKTTLEEEHAELTPSEITRHGIKLFKSVQSKSDSNEKGSDERNCTENGNKRKLDVANGEAVTSAPKQSKLSAFMYPKKT